MIVCSCVPHGTRKFTDTIIIGVSPRYVNGKSMVPLLKADLKCKKARQEGWKWSKTVL